MGWPCLLPGCYVQKATETSFLDCPSMGVGVITNTECSSPTNRAAGVRCTQGMQLVGNCATAAI